MPNIPQPAKAALDLIEQTRQSTMKAAFGATRPTMLRDLPTFRVDPRIGAVPNNAILDLVKRVDALSASPRALQTVTDAATRHNALFAGPKAMNSVLEVTTRHDALFGGLKFRDSLLEATVPGRGYMDDADLRPVYPLGEHIGQRLAEVRQAAEEAAAAAGVAHRDRVERENRMLVAMEEMRAAVIESAKREDEALARAERAEDGEVAARRFMIRMTTISVLIAFLSLLVAVFR